MNKTLKLALSVGAGALLLAVVISGLLAFSSEIPLESPGAPAPGEWTGAIHVHTALSDGGGTVADVARAASATGLDFVVLTDHNLRALPRDRYVEGVLMLVGEEVNTPWGHLVVVGADPVGSRSEADSGPPVNAWEGLRIVAHPSGRPDWERWDTAFFDGIEIWSADTERRHGDSRREWARALAILPWRPITALYQLLDSPENLELWDDLPAEAEVFGVCSMDAHNRLPLGDERFLPFPSYRQSFTLARQHVLVEEQPTGDAATDAQRVLGAIRRGRSYCAFDGLARAGGVRIMVLDGEGSDLGGPGDRVDWAPEAELVVELPPVGGLVRIRVLQDGGEVARGPGPTLRSPLAGPGRYRVEAWLEVDGRRLPWVLANPIRVVGTE